MTDDHGLPSFSPRHDESGSAQPGFRRSEKARGEIPRRSGMGGDVAADVAGAVIPTERQVQRAILAMAGTCFPDVVIHHSPNGAQLAGSDTARFKQIGALKGDGTKPGWPDLECFWQGGGTFLEVKRPKGGVISDAQKGVHERLSAIGWPVAVVRSTDEAHAALCAAGAPCRGRLV